MRSMRHRGQGDARRDRAPASRYVVEHSEVVGQLLFAALEDDQVALDVIPSSVRHPSGRTTRGAPFTLLARLPADPMWRGLLSGVLTRWAEDGEELGLDLFLEERKIVRLCSTGAMMRLDLLVQERDDADAC